MEAAEDSSELPLQLLEQERSQAFLVPLHLKDQVEAHLQEVDFLERLPEEQGLLEVEHQLQV